MRRFTVVVERDEDSGWLVAYVPTLRGCVTQAPTWEEPIANACEVLALCLETDEDDATEPIEGDGPLVGALQIEA